ncbi:MAG: inorganic phosphate transporter [Saprospiraceae bacterium]|nr:inorganic phosphate transporter [Saprospiraceae bacterium]
MFGLDTSITILLVICLFCAFAFDFINGFHDTANAVATVIYTHSLKPTYAIVLSGVLNFFGVLLGGIGVAVGIIKLLPVDDLLASGQLISVAVILATLFSAILWNLGTWYFGIPCSSSHTLIGSIIGAALGFTLYTSGNVADLNWTKAKEIGLALLLSPAIGFCLAFLIVMFFRRFIKRGHPIFGRPSEGSTPPIYIRLLLIFTCSLVSFFHGSNDGQKGVGLVMLILICLAPGYFAINHELDIKKIGVETQKIDNFLATIDKHLLEPDYLGPFESVKKANSNIADLLKQPTLTDLDKYAIRKNINTVSTKLKELVSANVLNFSKSQKEEMQGSIDTLKNYTDYAPKWVLLMISIALGLGTMIGWKRIVVTIGEKIGKEHLTYIQGASSELIAALTIGLSTWFHMPVSTTHVLSSGVAGTMVAKGGVGNLRKGTIRNIMLAWVLTLPVCMALGCGTFYIINLIIN